MKELGYGSACRYAHDEPEAYAAGERHFPDDLQEQHWYQPTPRGLEGKIAEKLAHLRKLDEKAGKKLGSLRVDMSMKCFLSTPHGNVSIQAIHAKMFNALRGAVCGPCREPSGLCEHSS